MAAILPEAGMWEPCEFRQQCNLVLLLAPDYFLQRNDVGSRVADNICYTLGRNATVDTSALVNVVGRNANGWRHAHYCCRSRIQPRTSWARSTTGRCFHSSSVISLLSAMSVSKSRSRRSASRDAETARFTSSLMPKERLSKLVEPTTAHNPSMIRIFA